jgi:hypothetical protein
MASVVLLLGVELELLEPEPAIEPVSDDSALPPHAARARGKERARAATAVRRVRFMVGLPASGGFDTSCSELLADRIALYRNNFR